MERPTSNSLAIDGGKLYLNPNSLGLKHGCRPVHLYATSSLPISLGDFFRNDDGVWLAEGVIPSSKDPRKIIATTDSDLISHGIAEIPKDYIKDYIEKYNAGKMLTSIDILYDEADNITNVITPPKEIFSGSDMIEFLVYASSGYTFSFEDNEPRYRKKNISYTVQQLFQKMADRRKSINHDNSH